MRSSDIMPQAGQVRGGHSLRQAQGRLCPPTAESKSTQAGNIFRCCLLALLTAFPLGAAAQKTASVHATAPSHAVQHFNSSAATLALGGAAYPYRFHRPFPYTSLPFPFSTDSFNPDDIYSTGYPVASQPPVILLQAARALTTPADNADHEPSPSSPLMIELQNGRYVRLNSAAADGEALPLALAADRAPSPPHDLPAVFLVFRDGHSEEVRDYTIADGILYARGDYYTDGYWNKKIAISTLNLNQTLEANATRSVRFVLPTSPNEVITRP
jgi:hypothetical protein